MSFLGIIFGKTTAGIGLVIVLALWVINTVKKIKKIKISSIDIHKSPNWENDNQIFLCIHNASFLNEIKNLSVVIAFINKVENGKFEFALNRSVILGEKINIRKMMRSTDIPFLEVVKKQHRFIIRAIHQETPNRDVFEHEFDCGKYVMQIVVKRYDVSRESTAIPIHVDYDGWDKISADIGEEFPKKTMFPIIL